MIKAKTLWVVALALGTVAPASSQTAALSPGSSEATFTPEQIHDYALALLQVQQIRKAAASQEASLAPDALPVIQAQASAQISQILDRRDLDDATFNAISAQVDRHRSLRRQVRQTMMQELVGF